MSDRLHAGLRDVVHGAAAALEAARQRIDDLNVYPVPDGDTGTNMTRTVRRIVEEVDGARLADPAEAARRLTRAALVGARGNSGVILSQIVRGLCDGLAGAQRLDAPALARALRAASDAAYAAVSQPVEGTILTVVRELAEEAEAAAGDELGPALDRVLARGEDALRRTPELLAKLREAGVVDAGGAGLLELARGAVAGLRGERPAAHAAPAAGGIAGDVVHAEGEESVFRYCTTFLVAAEDGALDRDALAARLAPLGDSLLVVGDGSALKVHVHVDDPGAAISLGAALGALSGIEVADMHGQVVDRNARLREGTSALRLPGVEARPQASGPHRRCDVVAVVAGAGNAQLALRLGARGVVSGGQTQNPSTEEILAAIEAAASDEVVVLPNNRNVVLAARAAADLAARPVVVVETASIPAGLAALDVYLPGRSAEDNAAAMRALVEGVATGDVTRAVRSATVDGVRVAEGAWLGRADGRLVASGASIADVAARVAAVLLGPERGRLTLLRGDGAAPGDLTAAIAAIRAGYPSAAIDEEAGDQPHYPLLLLARAAGHRLEAATTALVFDSTADVVPDAATRPSWAMVPLTVRFGDDEYRDHVDLSAPDFYRLLDARPTPPRTAAPSPGAFDAAYADLLERYRNVVSLHISGRLSSTVESARTAAAGFGGRVLVHDTLVVSASLALVIEAVQRMLDRGTTAAEIDAFIRAIPSRSGCTFGVDTLEHLQRNGRIGKGQALVGGWLGVRPILALQDGEVHPVGRVRGRRAMIPAIVEELTRRAAGFEHIDVAVIHADAPRDGERLLERIRDARGGIQTTRLAELGAVIGTHGGPGTIGAAFLAR